MLRKIPVFVAGLYLSLDIIAISMDFHATSSGGFSFIVMYILYWPVSYPVAALCGYLADKTSDITITWIFIVAAILVGTAWYYFLAKLIIMVGDRIRRFFSRKEVSKNQP